jgi:hypothetical protein
MGFVDVVLEIKSGRQDRSQCEVLEPANPPVPGIKCLGSDDMPRIILGRNC